MIIHMQIYKHMFIHSISGFPRFHMASLLPEKPMEVPGGFHREALGGGGGGLRPSLDRWDSLLKERWLFVGSKKVA